MGIYPVGTYVLLSDDRLVCNALPRNSKYFDQPTVALIKPSRIDERGEVIDLSHTDLRVTRSLPFRGVVASMIIY